MTCVAYTILWSEHTNTWFYVANYLYTTMINSLSDTYVNKCNILTKYVFEIFSSIVRRVCLSILANALYGILL